MEVLFDAVVFDLDGTLIATDRFWVQAARTGARRAFAELGLEREPPGASEWMDLVGKPLETGFEELFPDLSESDRNVIRKECVAEEHRLLEAGGSVLMPGTFEVLDALRAQGLRIAIASNCSQSYLDHMLALGIGERVEAAYCLDSPGIRSKKQMIGAALERFETRSAFMVGDRAGDRDAAWANGLPHVHCAFGFASREESIEAEGVIEDLPELLVLLAKRERWITSALEDAGAFRPPFQGGEASSRPPVLGIDGAPLSGKTLLARDAARVLRSRGQRVSVVPLDSFRMREAPGGDRPLESIIDVERLERSLLAPHAAGEAAEVPGSERVEAGDTLILEGTFLSDPRLSSRLTKLLCLELDQDRILMRAGALLRDRPEALGILRRSVLPAWQRFRERYPAGNVADGVLDGANPFGSGS